MGNAQGLRWWEEEKQAAPQRPAIPSAVTQAMEPIAETETADSGLLSEYRDVGEELEAEARRRVERAQLDAEPLVFLTDPVRERRVFRARTPFSYFTGIVGIVGGSVAWMLCLARLHAAGGSVGNLIFVYSLPAFACLLCWLLCRFVGKPQVVRPALTVSPSGIDMYRPDICRGPIPWSCVRNIRAERNGGLQNIGERGSDLVIELTDWDAFANILKPEYSDRLRRDLADSAPTGRELFGLRRRRSALPPPAIRVPDYRLPDDPEAVVARIAAYSASYRASALAQAISNSGSGE